MNITFPEISFLNYKSPSQRVRVLSELWMKNEMYCPVCGFDKLEKFPNNSKIGDFYCQNCREIYELKSKGRSIGKSILDGAYHTAVERVTSKTNPNLFVMRYDKKVIESLTLVPKYFFTPDILKLRHELSQRARRAGYVGSWIMYGDIPVQGKIAVIEAHKEIDKQIVMKNYMQAVKLKTEDMTLRGWLMEVLQCVNKIGDEIFSTGDIYAFAGELALKHSDNHNVKAKIRQQLQILRDKGFLEFLGNGKYRRQS